MTLGTRLRPGQTGDLRARLAGAGAEADLRARLAAAEDPAGFGVRELMAAKLGAALVAGIAGTLVASVAPGRLGYAIVLAAPLAGFLAPDVWLARAAAERARRVRRELPPLLDLLRVTVEAGASLGEALRAVGERSEGPLAQELRAVGRQVRLGVPLAVALDGLVERVPLAEVRALVRRSTAPAVTARRSRTRSPRRRATPASRSPAVFERRPLGPGRRSSWWWRCCSFRRCCSSWPRRWHRRCSTAGRGAAGVASAAVRTEGETP